MKFHVYFGGSFDPPHLGHHAILEALASDAWTHEIHLVPTAQNPLKGNPPWGSREERLAWTQAWLGAFQKQNPSSCRVRLETLELDQEGSFTARTLAVFRKKYSDKRPWALALGADAFGQLDRWFDVAGLLQEVNAFWVWRRPGQISVQEASAELRQKIPENFTVRDLCVPFPEMASSQLKRVFGNKDDSAWQKWVLPEVAALLKVKRGG